MSCLFGSGVTNVAIGGGERIEKRVMARKGPYGVGGGRHQDRWAKKNKPTEATNDSSHVLAGEARGKRR